MGKIRLFGVNGIATAINVIAIMTFIGGVIIGIIMGFQFSFEEMDVVFNFGYTIIYWFVALISGIMLMGFAQIIILLTEIRSKVQNTNVGKVENTGVQDSQLPKL